MTDRVPIDETSPFFVPPLPITTAADLLRTVEEVKERKKKFDSQLLAMLPNLITSAVVKSGELAAKNEGRSLCFQLDSTEIVALLPSHVRAALDKDCNLIESCRRIRKHLGKLVKDFLMQLGFNCSVIELDSLLRINISW